MLLTYFLFCLIIAFLSLYLMRKDSLFSPFKFILLINTIYILAPVGIYGVLNYNHSALIQIFPSLYSDFASIFMLHLYLYFVLIILGIRFLVRKKYNIDNLNNIDVTYSDRFVANIAVFFSLIGVIFILIAINMVGFDAYREYNIEATIGGNPVAQSFKSQGEMIFAIFSLPIIKYLFSKKRFISLFSLFLFLVIVSLIGGARKFLVFPFIFFIIAYLQNKVISKKDYWKYGVWGVGIIFVAAIIQGVREKAESIISLKLFTRTILDQIGFAYLVPNGYVYYNYDAILNIHFSIIDFFKQIFNPIVFSIPRFIFPQKDELIFEVTNPNLNFDFHTVGGNSFIEYFLSNSVWALIIAYPIIILLITCIFIINQKYKNSVLVYIYTGSLISLAWFNYNWGYVIATKFFIMQVVITLLLFNLCIMILRKWKPKIMNKNQNEKIIYINGRFLTQSITGVQRFAIQLLKSLDRIIVNNEYVAEKLTVIVLVPQSVVTQTDFVNIKIEKVGKLSGHLWEQIELPFFARNGLLINLCNTAPLLHFNQIATIHDAAVFAVPDGYSKAFRIWYKIVYFISSRIAHNIITVSNFSKRELCKYLKISEEKIGVIIEGKEHIYEHIADNAVLEKNSISMPFILAVSSMNPNKNFKGIVESLKYLDESFQVIIAGGTNPKVFGENLELSERVKHIGYVTDSELRALYEHASCFVYPSFYEGFGLPPIEAMALKCPVVVSNYGSLPEICDDAVLYCNPYDSKDIADKINQVMKDDVLRKALISKGESRADYYSWDIAAKEMIDHIVLTLNKN